jgi:hypothetical protein
VVNNSIAVIKTVQTKRGRRCIYIPRARIFTIVVIKFTAPIIDAAPAKCKLKIAKSIEAPECAKEPLSGGYTVQPVPTPSSTREDTSNKIKAGGNNQKLILFKRGVH